MIENEHACRVCKIVLNELPGEGDQPPTYVHPVTPYHAGHPVRPVPAAELDEDELVRGCHFCFNPYPVWRFHTSELHAFFVDEDLGFSQATYGSQWSACYTCTRLVEADQPAAAIERTLAALRYPPGSAKAARLRAVWETLMRERLPGRCLLTTTPWTPARLQAATLPKVRDRLAGLYTGIHELPGPLADRHLRHRLAAGLDQARLYWIDHQFTDLAAHAATTLPDTRLEAHDLPAPHGLAVWATPVTEHRIAAASWTTHDQRWQIICYRSVGADLPDELMTQLRAEIGWLIPIHILHLDPDTTIDHADPAAVLVATWLLINQKVAETAAAPVTKQIRKAYGRNHRPTPEVRLVRIRSRGSDSTARRTPGAGAPVERTSRWWVRGFFRSQPYGPRRAYRKTIWIEPHLRGPEDKPINPSTTVRVLGTANPHTPTE